jgi:tetratricopeptide (TPR) repeat protein
VYAANAERFDQAYKDVARKMELPRADDPETDVCELVSDWLNGEDSGQWLMILDNADKSDLFLKPLDPKASNRVNVTKKPLIDYLPAKMNSKRSLLITTRDRTLGENLSDGQPSIEVLPFAPEEGILLLRSRTGPVSDGWNDSDAATLVEVLGCIALAITQAAAFMRHNQMPLGRYLKALRGDERNLKDYLNTNLFDHRRERHVPHSIFRTWELSFDQIREQEPRAAEILSLMAMLDRQQIQEKLLRRKGERDAIFVTAMGSLGGLSLITKEVEEDTWTMHRLVQLSIHEWLEQRHQKRKYEEEALALIAGKFPSGEHENREACESLLPHAKSVLKYESDSNTSQIQRADLLYKVSWFHWKQGRYHLAYEKISETNELNKRLFSHLDLRSLNTSSLLASVLRELGKYKESEKLHRQVLKGREKVVGTKHPDTLASINNLAGVLRKQASYKEAEKLYRRALEKRKKLLGLEHPDTLTSFNNLASVLRYQEKFAEAADMHQRAWFGRIKVLGAEHPDTLISLDNLARTLRHQRKFKEAKEMHERVLRSREKELGSEHPTTLSSVHQLAAVFQDEELYEKAEELNRRALEGYEKVLGPDHPDTLHSVSNLAVVLHAKGQYNLASGLYRRTIVGFESCFGPRHATTLIWVGKHDAMLKEVRKIYGPAGINS